MSICLLDEKIPSLRVSEVFLLSLLLLPLLGLEITLRMENVRFRMLRFFSYFLSGVVQSAPALLFSVPIACVGFGARKEAGTRPEI